MKFTVKWKAFTAIELILSLGIMCMVLPAFYTILDTLNKDTLDYSSLEDNFAIDQLRLYLGFKNIQYDEGNTLEFISESGTYKLKLVNHKIMMHDGSLTFINNVDSLYFYEEGDFIMMEYKKDGIIHNVWVAVYEEME